MQILLSTRAAAGVILTSMLSKIWAHRKTIAIVVAATVAFALTLSGILFAIKVVSSPHYAVYKMNQAADKGNAAEFEKYYTVKSSSQDKSAIEDYKENYYQPLSLTQAKSLQVITERIGGGKLVYVPAGNQEVVMRLTKQGNKWQVVDIAKIDKQ